MINKIAILGAGNGGCTFAGHLAMKGFNVALYEDPKYIDNVKDIKDRGGIELSGAISGFGKIQIVSTDIKDIVPGADVIMVVTPAFAQMLFIERAVPYLEDGQIVVFNPDNFASLAFCEMLKQKGVKKNISIAGAESLMYATRKKTSSSVDVWAMKGSLLVAALPATQTTGVVNRLKEMFSEFTPAKNVLEISLANANMIIHCPTVILNAGRIEDTQGNFEFYWQGMTASVCRVMESMDEEKISVAEKIGVKLTSILDYLKHYYPSEKEAKGLHDFLTHSKVHGGRGPNAPKDLHHRYLVEDVANGLVPLSLLGKSVGVQTPTVDAIILLSSIMNKTDFFKTGRNLEELGLSGMRGDQILRYLHEGIK